MEKIKQLAQERLSSGQDEKNKMWNQFFSEGGAPVDRLEEASRINKYFSRLYIVCNSLSLSSFKFLTIRC